MRDKEYVEFLTKCANITYKDYSWLKDHCYRTLKKPCSPNIRNEHLAVLDLIKEHDERQRNDTNSVLEDIKAEIKEWYWQADKQAIAKDPCVVDAMIDLFIRTINAHISGEPKMGYWIRKKNALGEDITVCSECGTRMKQGEIKYCGACGTKMFELQESGE